MDKEGSKEGKGGEKVVSISRKLTPKYSIDQTEEEQEEKESLRQQKYDPNFVYRVSSDKRGHSISIAARVPPWIASKIQSITEAKGSPYSKRGSSEFVRDAIFHRIIHWTDQLNLKEMKSDIHKRYLTALVSDQEELETDFKDFMIMFRKRVLEYQYDPEKHIKLDKYIKMNIKEAKDTDYGDEPNEHLNAIKKILTETGINPDKYFKGDK